MSASCPRPTRRPTSTLLSGAALVGNSLVGVIDVDVLFDTLEGAA